VAPGGGARPGRFAPGHPAGCRLADPAPPLEAYLRLTPASGVRVEERRHPGERDLAVELSVCRAYGRSLLGAAPAELIGEVPDRWVVAAGDAQLAAWQAIGTTRRMPS